MKTAKLNNAQLETGRPYPLGAHWDGLGINFAVYSASAEAMELCIYDVAGRRETARLRLPECTNDIWHGYLRDATLPLVYGYRAFGPYDPEHGHRFNPHKLLLDPYARELVGDCALVGCAVRLSSQFTARGPEFRPSRQRLGDAQGGGQQRNLQLGRRPSAARAVDRYRHLRSARARIDHAPQRRAQLSARQFRGTRRSQIHRSHPPARRHCGGAAADPCVSTGSLPDRARAFELLGLQHARFLRAGAALSVERKSATKSARWCADCIRPASR